MTRGSVLRGPATGATLLGFALACFTSADPDLWGHLRFGLDIIADGRLPAEDPYSFTQDRPWLNHEWLSELTMGAAWTALGSAGLAILKGSLVMAGLWAVWSALGRLALTPRILVMGVAVVGMAPVLQTLRPQLWSFLGLALLCRCLIAERPRARWWLPLLFAIWANAHGGWLVGLGVLGAWAAATVWEHPATVGHWSGVFAASAVATLATPYGVSLWMFLLETVRLSRPMIEEWQPLWTFGPGRWLPWLAAVAAVGWAARTAVPGARWPRVVALSVLAYASLRVVRVYPLFVEATVILVAPLLARRWPAERPVVLAGTKGEWVAAAVIAVVTSAAAAVLAAQSLSCIVVSRAGMPESSPVRALAGSAPGRIVTYFNWGEYALWHVGPRLRVSMDGRRETVYSEARLAEHDDIVFGRPEGFEVLRDWQAEYVWLPAWSRATRAWLERNGYRIDWQSERSFVAVREDLPQLDSPGHEVPGQRRCFPG